MPVPMKNSSCSVVEKEISASLNQLTTHKVVLNSPNYLLGRMNVLLLVKSLGFIDYYSNKDIPPSIIKEGSGIDIKKKKKPQIYSIGKE